MSSCSTLSSVFGFNLSKFYYFSGYILIIHCDFCFSFVNDWILRFWLLNVPFLSVDIELLERSVVCDILFFCLLNISPSTSFHHFSYSLFPFFFPPLSFSSQDLLPLPFSLSTHTHMHTLCKYVLTVHCLMVYLDSKNSLTLISVFFSVVFFNGEWFFLPSKLTVLNHKLLRFFFYVFSYELYSYSFYSYSFIVTAL